MPGVSDRDQAQFATIEQAVEALRAGQFVVVVDDEDRENEGDLVLAAENASRRRRSISWRARAAG